jgi:6-phosphogluconolactonase
MTLNKIGRGALASMLSLAIGLGVTACSRDYTLAYMYTTTAKPLSSASRAGGINAFAVDFQSGALTVLADSPITAGANPVALAGSPNGKFLYVVNHDDSTVMTFAIGTDGKIFSQQTINTTGSSPTAISIDPTGSFVYVTFTYQVGPNGQQLYSPASPGPGGVTIFTIKSDGTLNAGTTVNVGNNPVGVVASHPVCSPTTPSNSANPTCTLTTGGGGAGNLSAFVYVLDQEPSPNATILGFAENMVTGLLTPAPGTVITTPPGGKTVATGYGAGVTPSAIAEDPSGRWVYVTDEATNQLYANLVTTGGALSPLTGGPFNTGLFPVGLTIDPRGQFLYVANFSAGSVSAYAINQATGAPVGSVGSSAQAAGTGVAALAIDPALGIYLYTADNLANTTTALQLDPHNGTLKLVQNSPFTTSALPTAVAVVANGSHPSQLINP